MVMPPDDNIQNDYSHIAKQRYQTYGGVLIYRFYCRFIY